MKVDPMTQSDYHWASISPYYRFLQHFTGLQLKTMGEFQILLGVVLGWQMIARYGPERLKFLHTILSQRWNKELKGRDLDSKKIEQEDRGEWQKDLDSISLGFLGEITRRIDKVLRRFDDVIAYA